MASIPLTTFYFSHVDLPREVFLFDSRTVTHPVRCWAILLEHQTAGKGNVCFSQEGGSAWLVREVHNCRSLQCSYKWSQTLILT